MIFFFILRWLRTSVHDCFLMRSENMLLLSYALIAIFVIGEELFLGIT